MDVHEVCQRRSITILGVTTPLLVPSFSSRGFPNVGGIHRLLRDYLFDSSLVSAYDLFRGVLFQPEVFATEVLFVDSGGYEARAFVDVTEPYLDERVGLEWTLESYQRTLESLVSFSRLIMVSFDFAAPAPLSDQIHLAQALFQHYPNIASDFLCKPTSSDASFVDTKEVVAAVNELESFDVIGFTEKELGDTALDRCRSLMQFRSELHRHGRETPIHVFGCLDPITILAYFLCGADIFDGLAWLRFAFSDGIPIYHPTNLLLRDMWTKRDQDVLAMQRVENLQWLRTQRRAMEDYCQRYVLEDFGQARGLVERVLPLVRAAGLQI
jgi:hypothetical protein